MLRQTASYSEFTQQMYFITPDLLKWYRRYSRLLMINHARFYDYV
jgi:hypothetical protein